MDRGGAAVEALAGLTVTRVETRMLLNRMWTLRDRCSGYDAAYVAIAAACSFSQSEVINRTSRSKTAFKPASGPVDHGLKRCSRLTRATQSMIISMVVLDNLRYDGPERPPREFMVEQITLSLGTPHGGSVGNGANVDPRLDQLGCGVVPRFVDRTPDAQPSKGVRSGVSHASSIASFASRLMSRKVRSDQRRVNRRWSGGAPGKIRTCDRRIRSLVTPVSAGVA